ncbi:TonB family protein [Chitinophaga sp. SYP-B3965]|uniref:M56 family metallopeptidase n=1 Tax=Chitinophaga sp. SYP-B3965 TaxID=2663120 RepID=UPI001299B218|nr:M56 family metallopeptidase [Chitinophaga sp. SYP-B3965]MRG47076.1 TonB family protein [Chitinophaga sp. SYP-B3965]
MTPLLAYLAKVIICSGILYAYYHLALRNNRFHQWNRFYLLLCTILSLIVPLLRIPISFTPEGTDTIFVYTSQVVTLREQVFTPAKALPVFHFNWAALLYVIVIVTLVGRLLFGYGKIFLLIHKSHVEFVKPYWFVLSEHITSPFSFFRYIFWNNRVNADTSEGRQMLRHEMVHMQEKHSTDKLFMEIITAVCWINPFFHLIKRELSLIHEFIADKKAVVNGDVADYAQTILQMALQTNRTFSMTNNFSHQPIKRRILMLTQSRKLRFSYLRRLMILPIAIMIFSSLAFVITEENFIAAPLDIQQKKDSTVKPPPAPPKQKIQFKPAQKNGKEVFTFVEQPPSFPGGDQGLNKYLAHTIRYPHMAVERNVGGTVFVSFVVTKEGEVTDVTTVGNPKGHGLEEEAIRVVEKMPNWTPGKQNGQLVNVQFNLPIRFTMQGGEPVKKISNDGAYLMVEEMPTYPGGEVAMMNYLSQHVKYPKEAVAKKLEGTVYVSFDINPDGSVSNAKSVHKPKDGGLEDEAIRVVNGMPKWNPGKEKGEPVRVKFVLPISFKLGQ